MSIDSPVALHAGESPLQPIASCISISTPSHMGVQFASPKPGIHFHMSRGSVSSGFMVPATGTENEHKVFEFCGLLDNIQPPNAFVQAEMASATSAFVTTVASRLLHASLLVVEGNQTDTTQSAKTHNLSCSNPSTLKVPIVDCFQNDDAHDEEGNSIRQQLRVDLARRCNLLGAKNERTTSSSTAHPSSTQQGFPSSATTQKKLVAKDKKRYVSFWVSEEEQKHKNTKITLWMESCTM